MNTYVIEVRETTKIYYNVVAETYEEAWERFGNFIYDNIPVVCNDLEQSENRDTDYDVVNDYSGGATFAECVSGYRAPHIVLE